MAAKTAVAMKETAVTTSKKPAAPPKKAEKQEKVEHHHAPLPTLKPVKPMDVATLRSRLTEVGVTWAKNEDADTLKARLDSALKEKAVELEDEWLEDENDCFGKPDMRIAEDPDCQRCPDNKRCGLTVAKVLDARKDIVGDVSDETDAEAEAAEVEESEVPEKSVKARSKGVVQQAFIRPEDVTEVSDKYVLDYDDKPSFDEDDSPRIREAVEFIYQHKPESMAEFRRIVVLGFLRKKKSEANEVTVGLIQKLVDGGFFRVKLAPEKKAEEE